MLGHTSKQSCLIIFSMLTAFCMACRNGDHESELAGNAASNASGKSDGVFMSYADDATEENFKIIADAGFGKLFFHIAGRGNFAWDDGTWGGGATGRSNLKAAFAKAKSAGLKVILWIEHGPYLEPYNQILETLFGGRVAATLCTEDQLSYLNLGKKDIQDAFIRGYVGEVTKFAQESGLDTIHIDDKFRLPKNCPNANFEDLRNTVRRIKDELGVEIDFSHLPLNYSTATYRTDWSQFSLPKKLTSVQTYVNASFKNDAQAAASQGLGGVILAAGAGSSMTAMQAAENYKWVKANTKLAAHIFSFHSLYGGQDSASTKRKLVSDFFSSVAVSSSVQSNSTKKSNGVGEQEGGSESDASPAPALCAPVTGEGQDAMRACLNDLPAYMHTVKNGGESFVPVYKSLPAQAEEPLDIGLNANVTVARLRTCFIASKGVHFSEVQIFDTTETSLNVNQKYWVKLRNLSCGKK